MARQRAPTTPPLQGHTAHRRTGAPALLVFAAASLGDALSKVDADFTARTGIDVKASFAASAVLARQIEAGGPADVFSFSRMRSVWITSSSALRGLPRKRRGECDLQALTLRAARFR
jgi:hypothetical protein